MNVEQFTNKVKEQISAAQIKALQKQHQQLLSLHMLSVLLEEKDIVVPLLQQTGTNLSTLQNDIDKEIERFKAFEAAGQTQLSLRLHDDPIQALDLIGQKVIPHFK